MGMSTDAYLYYGVEVYDAEEDSQWLDKIERPSTVSKDDWSYDWDDQYRNIDRLTEHLISTGYGNVKFDCHCHAEYPIWFIYIRQTYASRGFPEKIKSLEVPAEKHQLIEVLYMLGAPKKVIKDIGWYLASYCG